jgi:hypothetical protein
MSIFVDHFFYSIVEILRRHIDRGIPLTEEDGSTLRAAWVYSPRALGGNFLLDAIKEAAPATDTRGMVSRICAAPGFLRDEEARHTERLRGQKITAWRGAMQSEAGSGDLGLSWTTNFRVAEFFARRCEIFAGGGVVLKAELSADAWLSTVESELIVTATPRAKIVSTPDLFVPIEADDWPSLKPIPPTFGGDADAVH